MLLHCIVTRVVPCRLECLQQMHSQLQHHNSPHQSDNCPKVTIGTKPCSLADLGLPEPDSQTVNHPIRVLRLPAQ